MDVLPLSCGPRHWGQFDWGSAARESKEAHPPIAPARKICCKSRFFTRAIFHELGLEAKKNESQ